jgi:hypothetical protein
MAEEETLRERQRKDMLEEETLREWQRKDILHGRTRDEKVPSQAHVTRASKTTSNGKKRSIITS